MRGKLEGFAILNFKNKHLLFLQIKNTT